MLCSPGRAAFDSSGNLWVADTGNNRILEYLYPYVTPSLVIGQTSFTSKVCSSRLSGLCGPEGLFFDSLGNLWVADTGNNRIVEYSSPFYTGMSANPGMIIGTGCVSPPMLSSLCGPTDLWFGYGPPGGIGNLWVADSGDNRILVFDYPQTGGMSADPGMVIGSGCVSPPTASSLCAPEGLTINYGNLYVADTGDNRVMEYPGPSFSTGMSGSLIAGSGCVSPPTASSLCGPTGLAFDTSHDLWVADTGIATSPANRIVECPYSSISPGTACAFTTFIGQSSPTTGGSGNCAACLEGPEGITFDLSGNLWVADTANYRIIDYAPPFTTGMTASSVTGVPLSISCTPSSLLVSSTKTITCDAVVTGSKPTGAMTFFQQSFGPLPGSLTTLPTPTCTSISKKLTCSVSATVTAAGEVMVCAVYIGNLVPSSGCSLVNVLRIPTSLTLTCSPKVLPIGSGVYSTCTATILTVGSIGGETVYFFQLGSGAACFGSSCVYPAWSLMTTCTLPPSLPYTCTATVWGAMAGSAKIEATYTGDPNNGASQGTSTITVSLPYP